MGSTDADHLTDDERADLVAELVAAGHRDRILLSGGAIGVAKGLEAPAVGFDHVLTTFAPLLRARGLTDADVTALLATNPAAWLSVQTKEA